MRNTPHCQLQAELEDQTQPATAQVVLWSSDPGQVGSEFGGAEGESVEAVVSSRETFGAAVGGHDQQVVVGAAPEDGGHGGTPAGRGRRVAIGHSASLRVGSRKRDPNQVMNDDVAHPTLSLPGETT